MHGQLDELKPERGGNAPRAIARKIGKGQAMHICTSIFAQYAQCGDPQMLRWLREIFDLLQPTPLLTTDAPLLGRCVRCDARGTNGWCIFVNQNPRA